MKPKTNTPRSLLKGVYGLLSDRDITKLCVGTKTPMITPFVEKQVGNGIISYGLSSYGYDIRVGYDFKIFTNLNSTSVIDPKNFAKESLHDIHVDKGGFIQIPPNSYALCCSLERFNLPRDVTGICLGKSTYARCGIICNITPLEGGWTGFLTLELGCATPLPARIYAGEGIAQILFFRGQTQCNISYADRGGKYQNQVGVVPARILK